MRSRTLAAIEYALLSPALLFFTALVVRSLLPVHSLPASTAQRIIDWYAGRLWTLWALLVTLPLVVLASGAIFLLRGSGGRGEPPGVSAQLSKAVRRNAGIGGVFTTTILAAGILAIVVLHILAN